MKRFESFDISNFFDEVRAPVIMFDENEIIFINVFFKENFQEPSGSWRNIFKKPVHQKLLEDFFKCGKIIKAKTFQTLADKEGIKRSFQWDFTNLPSSYDSRFLVAIGEEKEVIPEKPALFIENPEDYSQQEIQYLRTILDNTHDLIAILDMEGNYKFISPSVGEKLGFSVNEIVGRNFQDFIANGALEVTTGDYKSVLESKDEVNINFWIKGRNGQRMYIESFAKNLLDDPYIKGILFSARDITELEEIKESLLKSEEKYRRLVEDSTEIIFSISDDFILKYVSPNVTQFLGYQSDEVIGNSIFNYMSEEDIFKFQEMSSGEQDFLSENQFLQFRLRHKFGGYRVFSSNGKVSTNRLTSERTYTGIARDITELKEAQHALLEQKEKAEHAAAIKSQFLSIMSHEIRTPLNAVVGIAHILMNENPREDQLENLRTLQFSAENLTGLINDILDFSKIDSGKIELELVPFDLRTSMNRIVHSYSFLASEKNLDLACEIDENISEMLIGDPVRISQIVNNLISNAIKFTEKGEVMLKLELVGEIDKSVQVKFRCLDTGIGIPEDKRDKIFELFTQASADTTRKYGGTGLGLAIVKRLVELHRSEINIEPRLNGGTEFNFVVSFDIPNIKMEDNKEEKGQMKKSLQEVRILVAEDNMVNQILLQKFLTKWDVGELVLCSDGQEAIEAIKNHNFDLVLLDIQMPVFDGFEVARFIRDHSDPIKSKVPILVLTAASIHEVTDKIQEISINDFVPKPFTPESLYDKILGQLKNKD